MEKLEKRNQAVIRRHLRGRAALVLRMTWTMSVGLGSFAAVCMLVDTDFTPRALTAVLGFYVVSAIGGALVGLTSWIELERNFFKLKMQSMEKKLAEFGSTDWDRWPDAAS